MAAPSRFPEHEVRTPQTRGEWYFYLVFLGVIAAMFAASIVSEFSLSKLVAVFYLVFWVPLLVLHELGHAAMAKLLGWYAGQLVIGVGPTARRLRLGETNVEIRSFPVEGFVRCVPRNLSWPRTKNAMVYFAGPGIELLLVALIVGLSGPDTILHPPTTVTIAALQGLCLAAASGAVINLIPHSVITSDGDVPNDGLGILWSFLLPTEYFAGQIGGVYNPSTGVWERNERGN